MPQKVDVDAIKDPGRKARVIQLLSIPRRSVPQNQKPKNFNNYKITIKVELLDNSNEPSFTPNSFQTEFKGLSITDFLKEANNWLRFWHYNYFMPSLNKSKAFKFYSLISKQKRMDKIAHTQDTMADE